MKANRKRLISILLSICVVVTMTPAFAWAETDAIAAAAIAPASEAAMPASEVATAAPSEAAMPASEVATAAPAEAASFSDTQGHWAEADIEKWSDYGIVRGSGQRFDPNRAITRGELAVILDRVMSYQTQSANTFDDLGDSWYADSILRLNANGIMNGDGGHIRGDEKVSRQEAMVMFARAFQLKAGTADGAADAQTADAQTAAFADAADIAPWASDSIAALKSAGYISGDGGQLRPEAAFSRAETVTLLGNIVDVYCTGPLDLTGQTVGNVLLATSGASISGGAIDGSLYVAPGVGDGEVRVSGTTIRGDAYVLGGGEKSVHFDNVTVLGVIVENVPLAVEQTVQTRSGGHSAPAKTETWWEKFERIGVAAETQTFDELIESVNIAVRNNDVDAFAALYDEGEYHIDLIRDLGSYWEIKTYENVTDTAAQAKKNDFEALYDSANVRFNNAYATVLCSEETYPELCEALAEHVSNAAIIESLKRSAGASTGGTVDAELQALERRDNELMGLFGTLSNSYLYTYEYADPENPGSTREYNLGEVVNLAGEYAAMYAAYPEFYVGMVNDVLPPFKNRLAELFVEMIDVRTAIAEKKGLSSYADYADPVRYISDEMATFRGTVKEYFTSNGAFSYSDYFSMNHEIDNDEMIDFMRDNLSALDPCLEEAINCMIDNRLYSIGKEPARASAGYTVEFLTLQKPFIFNQYWDNYTGYTGQIHEVGHFTRSYWLPPGRQAYTGQHIFDELHSTGLELLAIPIVEEAFPEAADLYGQYVVAYIANNILEGCLYDEFQREVYAHPEWEVSDVNDYYLGLCETYGVSKGALDWTSINHLFNSPMYYINYAISSFEALQIYSASLADYQAGVDLWKTAIFEEFTGSLLGSFEAVGLYSIADHDDVMMVLNSIAR